VAFVRWCRLNGIFVYAIPNGGARNAITGKRLKDEGVLPGVPDLFLPELKLFIEMKAPNGYCSEYQKQMIFDLQQAGYNVAVCHSADEAMQIVKCFKHLGEK